MADLESAEVSSSLALSESGASDMTMLNGQAASSATLSDAATLHMALISASASTSLTVSESLSKKLQTAINATLNPAEYVIVGGATNTPYLYVVDSGNNRVNAYEYTGAFVFSFGSYGAGDGQFSSPYGITTDGDYLYVTDSGNNRVQVFTMLGVYVAQFGSYGTGNGQFDNPMGISVDSNWIWVVDNGNNRFQIFYTITYDWLYKLGTYGSGVDQFDGPTDSSIDDLYFYINDAGNARIVKYEKNIDFPTVADAYFPMLQISAAGECRSGLTDASLPAIISAGTSMNDVLASADVSLPILSIDAYSAAYSDASIPPITSSGQATARLFGESASELPALVSAGSLQVFPIIRFLGELPALNISSRGFGGSFATSYASLPAIRISSSGYGGRLLQGASSLPPFEMIGTVLAHVTGQGLLILPALEVAAYGHYLSATGTFSIITMNTKRNAVTEYTNMPFNSIAQVNGEILALNGSNMYVLGNTLGDELVDGNATNIPASFRTFRMDFFAGYGDVPNVLRKVREAWMLSRNNGNLRLTITDDENLTYVYDINDTNQFIHDTRVKFARGIKGRHFDFNIQNVNGADFEMFSWRVKAEAFEHRRR